MLNKTVPSRLILFSYFETNVKEVNYMGLDWKPRHRDMLIGGYWWLARVSDKARAKLNGTIGEYIYP